MKGIYVSQRIVLSLLWCTVVPSANVSPSDETTALNECRDRHGVILAQPRRAGRLQRQFSDDTGVLKPDRRGVFKQLDSRWLVRYEYQDTGDAGVVCLTPDLQFHLSGEQDSYRVAALHREQQPSPDTGTLHDFIGMVDPWADQTFLYGEPIAEVLAGSSTRIACPNWTVTSRGLELTWDQRPFGGALHGQLVLDVENDYRPIINSFTNSRNQTEIRKTYQYGSSDNGEPLIETTVEFDQGSGNWIIESVEVFEEDSSIAIDADEFTLSHYGIPDTLGQPQFNRSLWLLIAAGIVLTAAFWRLSRAGRQNDEA